MARKCDSKNAITTSRRPESPLPTDALRNIWRTKGDFLVDIGSCAKFSPKLSFSVACTLEKPTHIDIDITRDGLQSVSIAQP